MILQSEAVGVADKPIVGKCATCGAKNVHVSHPPLSRCVDMKKCDAQRARNAENLRDGDWAAVRRALTVVTKSTRAT